jgi:anti-sigma factor RsiW
VADQEALTCDDAQLLVRAATRGELDEATRGRVYAHIATCPACAQLAEAERSLDQLLEEKLPRQAAPLGLVRRLQERMAPLSPVAPVTPTAPGATTPAAPARPSARAARRLGRWLGPASLAAAACAVLLVLARPPARPMGEPLVREAVADHLRDVYRERPVDIESGGPHQVKPWFTGRLDFALPSVFSGDGDVTLTGGSVGYYLDRKAAVLIYKCRLHTVSLFVFRADGLAFPAGDHPLGGGVRAALRHERGFQVVLFSDGELGYALVSDLNADELLRLAAHVAGGA